MWQQPVALGTWWGLGAGVLPAGCNPAAGCLFGAGLGALGSAHPFLSRGEPRIWLENAPPVEETIGAAACCWGAASGEEGWLGEPPAPAPRADACLCPGLVFRGAGIPGICKELGSGWGRAGRLLQHEPSGLFSLCAQQCLG